VTPVPRELLSHKQRRLHDAGIATCKGKKAPLFPRYVFVRFDVMRDPWHGIFAVAGVNGLVCENRQPVAIGDELVAGFKAREIDGAVPAATPTAEIFNPGDTVRIVEGGFEGHKVMVEEVKRGTIGGVDVFGRPVPVELEPHLVVRA
jgi:transcription antitermination factor NusG